MVMQLAALFLLTIIGVAAIWHMDVNQNLERFRKKQTEGIFKISPEVGFRYSEYVLIAVIFAFDLLFIFLLFH